MNTNLTPASQTTSPLRGVPAAPSQALVCPGAAHPRNAPPAPPRAQPVGRSLLLSIAAATTVLAMSAASLHASESDDRIEAAFKSSHIAKTSLKDDAIKPQAKDGVVTLTGTVADESHKALAQETAAGLPGVTKVDNQLATKAEAAAEKSDAWIVRKLKVVLFFHRNVSSATQIEVKEGIVTLKGEATSMAQKELTTEYAKDVDGVKSVRNEMVISAKPELIERTSGEKIDDASITAQVHFALLSHRSTNATQTKVETRNGEVTLTGIAKNAAEKALVTKLVTDLKGVTSVKNQMTVEETATR